MDEEDRHVSVDVRPSVFFILVAGCSREPVWREGVFLVEDLGGGEEVICGSRLSGA